MDLIDWGMLNNMKCAENGVYANRDNYIFTVVISISIQ